ncbi:MAG: protein kinase [Elusimicrobia bacterium]|nr:protein kinase [Elusimicrobiota bacterium]
MLESLKTSYLHRQREKQFAAQDWAGLAQSCKALIELDNTEFKAFHDLLWALHKLKDFAGARPYVDGALATAPQASVVNRIALEGPRYCRHLLAAAEVLMRTREPQRAVRLLLGLKRAGTQFHQKHFLLSEARQEEGDYAQAALEMEEMRALYAAAKVNQWEHLIVVRCREILKAALAKKDADAVYLCYRTIMRCKGTFGQTAEYVAARATEPTLAQEHSILVAIEAQERGDAAKAAPAIEKLAWPAMQDILRAVSARLARRPADGAAALARLAPASLMRFEESKVLAAGGDGDAAFLRGFAECALANGRLEEAFEAAQSASIAKGASTADLGLRRDVQSLLVERAVLEDEARLKRPGAAGGLGRFEEADRLEVKLGERIFEVQPSNSYRLAAAQQVFDPASIKLRLAINYLRLSRRLDDAEKILESLSVDRSLVRTEALLRLAAIKIRKDAAAAPQWLAKVLPILGGLDAEEAKRSLLALADACESSGNADTAREACRELLKLAPGDPDAENRLKALEAGRRRAPEPTQDAPGLRERFSDLRLLGRGGMGVVYRAVDPLFSRDVAVKVLADRFRDEPEVLARFQREGEAMLRLVQHPSIVRVFEVGVGRDVYIAMEFVEGKSLRDVLREKGKLPLADVLRYGGEIAEALAFAHSQGIVHRDIKPDNVLVAKNGATKLTDFGLAELSSATRITNSGTTMGTGQYMSPEQARGGDVGAPSDIYSLGMTLFELAAGRVPFERGDLAYRHIHELPAAPSSVLPGLPPAFDAVILRCVEKDPAKRFPDCAALAAALKEAARA